MSLLDWLRKTFSGPVHIADGGDPEAAADLHEEFGVPSAAETEVTRMAETGGLTGEYGRAVAGETAEGELESEEAPPDPAP